MNRKVNTRTSLFLPRLLAEPLSPKSQLPPEFLPSYIFSKRETKEEGEWEAREEESERGEKGGQPHMCLCVCVQKAHPQKNACKHTFIYTHSHCSSNSSSNSRPFSGLV